MSVWHVWGDYCHTRPDSIGRSRVVHDDDGRARKTAEAQGFDFQRRVRNGFEPWAAEFIGDDDLEFELASYPTVRGWKRL